MSTLTGLILGAAITSSEEAQRLIILRHCFLPYEVTLILSGYPERRPKSSHYCEVFKAFNAESSLFLALTHAMLGFNISVRLVLAIRRFHGYPFLHLPRSLAVEHFKGFTSGITR